MNPVCWPVIYTMFRGCVLNLGVMLMGVLISTYAVAETKDSMAEENLPIDFTSFVSAYENKDWPTVYFLLADNASIGLGGFHGEEGFKTVFVNNKSCYKALLFALKQGCYQQQSGKDAICASPPQLVQPEVIVPGAFARFHFDVTKKRWMAYQLSCGGE